LAEISDYFAICRFFPISAITDTLAFRRLLFPFANTAEFCRLLKTVYRLLFTGYWTSFFATSESGSPIPRGLKAQPIVAYGNAIGTVTPKKIKG
jgi:hypothetical protein